MEQRRTSQKKSEGKKGRRKKRRKMRKQDCETRKEVKESKSEL